MGGNSANCVQSARGTMIPPDQLGGGTGPSILPPANAGAPALLLVPFKNNQKNQIDFTNHLVHTAFSLRILMQASSKDDTK